MNEKKYEIWLVSNGRRSDFVEKGYTGQGWPDACRLLEADLTHNDCRARFLEFAEENFRRVEGPYDEAFRNAEGPCDDSMTDDEIEEHRKLGDAAAEKALADYLAKVATEDDPREWAFEYHEDLQYVMVKEADNL